MPTVDKIVLEETDMFGTIVRFHEKNYDKHKSKHPELRTKKFHPQEITMALKSPSFIIEGNQQDTICYYLELFRIRDIIKFAKVVVRETDRHSPTDPHCIIKTAFKTDHVQELKYGYVPTYYNK